MMKKIVIIFLGLMLSFMSLTINNEEVKASDNQSIASPIEDNVFDLTNNETQEIRFLNEQNEEVVYGIEPIINPRTPKVANGKWKIYFYSGPANCSFYINISDNKITSAYDPWHLFVGAAVNSAILKKDSSKQATYYFQFGTPIWNFGGWTGYLRAKINSNNNLVVSIQ